jgi:predicted DNA-binding helix-hairpin-helix protein
LKNFGVVVKRAKNFITINGKIPAWGGNNEKSIDGYTLSRI